MAITEITAKTILRKYKRLDSWFISRYGMNLYRGCLHNCVYCDGRSEKYRVNGTFGEDIEVKVNALKILDRELDPARKRKPLKPGFIFLGGGVNDCYQPVEKKYRLTRGVLEIIDKYGFAVHILTKSTLVERDLDLILQINRQHRAIVSMSFSSVDDNLAQVFEPGVPPPSQRLQTLARLKAAGLACGMYLMPVLPLVSDKPQYIDRAVKAAAAAGLDFVICAGLTLKEGRQMVHFYRVLEQHFPDLGHDYRVLYYGHPYGQAKAEYYDSLNALFFSVTSHYRMPCRIPVRLYNDQVDENDRVVVMLDHLDYHYKLEGRRSAFGYAAYVLSRVTEPLSSRIHSLEQIRGVGKVTAGLVREILKTGGLELLKEYYL